MQGKRTTDIVARLGGDEFAILLPETNLSQARIVADRIHREVAHPHTIEPTDVDSNFTLSLGLAEATASMSGVEALLRAADKALYVAKFAGRNCIREDAGIAALSSHAAE